MLMEDGIIFCLLFLLLPAAVFYPRVRRVRKVLAGALWLWLFPNADHHTLEVASRVPGDHLSH